MEEKTAGGGAHILIVDDEANVRRVLGALLEQAGYRTTRAAGGAEALDLVRAQDPDLVITDLKMPGMDGLELLRRIREGFPEIPVVLLSAHGTVEAAVEAMKRGAHDFLIKPFHKAKVLQVIGTATGHAARGRLDFQGPLVEGQPCGIPGRSPAARALHRMIERIAPSPSTVLIKGETGTGKELVAEALHQLSPRRGGPLVKVNCGALPASLVESELFGHEKGAFTGADRSRPGRFELAHTGTLFLDEVGELPPPAQVNLLRVLQDGLVDRVGGTAPVRVDLRLIAATHRDLEAEAAAGRFRQDLLYRLKVVEIPVPSLDRRREDIPLLVDLFLDKHSRRLERSRPGVSASALEWLSRREWPGNIRELENLVERALLLAEGPVLTPRDFEDPAGDPAPEAGPGGTDLKAQSRAAAAAAERRLIRAALAFTSGNVTRAAARLGLSRRGLQLKMKDLDLGSSD